MVNALAFGPRGLGSHPGSATILLSSNLGQVVYSHASPVFSASRNLSTKGSIRISDLTDLKA